MLFSISFIPSINITFSTALILESCSRWHCVGDVVSSISFSISSTKPSRFTCVPADNYRLMSRANIYEQKQHTSLTERRNLERDGSWLQLNSKACSHRTKLFLMTAGELMPDSFAVEKSPPCSVHLTKDNEPLYGTSLSSWISPLMRYSLFWGADSTDFRQIAFIAELWINESGDPSHHTNDVREGLSRPQRQRRTRTRSNLLFGLCRRLLLGGTKESNEDSRSYIIPISHLNRIFRVFEVGSR